VDRSIGSRTGAAGNVNTPSETRIAASSPAWIPAIGVAAFVTGASTVIMGALPLLIGLFAERHGLNFQQIGWIGAAGEAGTFSGVLLAYWLIERGMLRLGMQFGAAIALVFVLLTAAAETFQSLLSWRALTATGVGCVFAIGTYVLGRSAVPARSFSLMSGVQVVCGSAQAAVLPWIHLHFGYVAAVSSVAFWFAVILILVSWMSPVAKTEVARSESAPESTPAVRGRFMSARLLVAVLAFQTSVVVIWLYSERMAMAAGLPREHIAAAIALGNLGGLAASLLGTLAGERVGYLRTVLLATIAIVCGELLILDASSVVAYAVGQFVFNFGWLLGVSYYLGMLAKSDSSGRMIRLAPFALVFAGALGPLLVASFTASDSPNPIVGLSLFFCAGAFALAMTRLHRSVDSSK
jgi:predicted MFS family arabinose efflux permease